MQPFPEPHSVDLVFSTERHERAGHRRRDEEWLGQAWADPRSLVLVMAGSRFEVVEDQVGWVSPGQAPEGLRLLLSEIDDIARFLVLADDFTAPEHWSVLRDVAERLAPQEQGLLVQALSLAEWHRSHRFCGRCGAGLEARESGYVLACSSCGRQHFPRTDPAVIMLVTDGDRALLGRQAAWPPGRYSTLAGFVDPGESLEQAVVREVQEEAGVTVTDVTYYANQPWPFPSSLMVGFFARAVTTEINVDGDELEDAKWFSREQLAAEAEAGTLGLPGRISISRALIEAWYGAQLPGSW